jgi:NADH dehydrogenase (ubiquinone) Fe-S protein 7
MLSLSGRALPRTLRGMYSHYRHWSLRSSRPIVLPDQALCASRLPRVALLSTSSTKAATALEQRGNAGLTASGKARREVPLPSQEKKEGAMQYVLCVVLMRLFYWEIVD